MGKSQPKVPSVTETASAQTGSNISTAIGQQQLNAVNQVTPYGSLNYTQNGTYDYTDPTTGKTYKLPKLTATTTLSQGQQQLYDTGMGTQQNLANLAQDQSTRLSGLLAEPFSLDNDATEGRLNELASKRLDPQLAQGRQSEIDRLANAGIKLGSTAYDRAMTQLNQKDNDARTQLLLTGRNQAVQEALLQRNQPLNEIIGLASGTQVQNPQFASTPQTGLAGTDVAGITQQNYANQMGAYNNNQQQLGGLFGTLGTVGAAALPFMFSDKRLKTDIKKVGKTNDGQNLYSYRYKAGGPTQVGLMAQEVQKKHPEAVTKLSGFLAVDYGKALEAA